VAVLSGARRYYWAWWRGDAAGGHAAIVGHPDVGLLAAVEMGRPEQARVIPIQGATGRGGRGVDGRLDLWCSGWAVGRCPDRARAVTPGHGRRGAPCWSPGRLARRVGRLEAGSAVRGDGAAWCAIPGAGHQRWAGPGRGPVRRPSRGGADNVPPAAARCCHLVHGLACSGRAAAPARDRAVAVTLANACGLLGVRACDGWKRGLPAGSPAGARNCTWWPPIRPRRPSLRRRDGPVDEVVPARRYAARPVGPVGAWAARYFGSEQSASETRRRGAAAGRSVRSACR